jgi:hypothetical protein
MSDQNPIHRDRGRRDVAGQPAADAKETFAENQAQIDRNAAQQGETGEALTDEQREELRKQSASERLAKAQREHDEKSNS